MERHGGNKRLLRQPELGNPCAPENISCALGATHAGRREEHPERTPNARQTRLALHEKLQPSRIACWTGLCPSRRGLGRGYRSRHHFARRSRSEDRIVRDAILRTHCALAAIPPILALLKPQPADSTHT